MSPRRRSNTIEYTLYALVVVSALAVVLLGMWEAAPGQTKAIKPVAVRPTPTCHEPAVDPMPTPDRLRQHKILYQAV